MLDGLREAECFPVAIDSRVPVTLRFQHGRLCRQPFGYVLSEVTRTAELEEMIDQVQRLVVPLQPYQSACLSFVRNRWLRNLRVRFGELNRTIEVRQRLLISAYLNDASAHE